MFGYCGLCIVGGNELLFFIFLILDIMIKEIVFVLVVFSCIICKFYILDMNVFICFYIFFGLFLLFFLIFWIFLNLWNFVCL